MPLWSGRFRKGLHPDALRFSSSLSVDRQLFEEDIEGSIAHAQMLAACKIIPKSDAVKIVRGLKQIRVELRKGKFQPHYSGTDRFVAEDIHMAIEQRLMKKIGPAGGRLHTARSRNDQIALDERLYLRKQITTTTRLLRRLQRVFVSKAQQYSDVVMPGYTHLQQAQPVLLAHHLLAYVSMFDRDLHRFEDCLHRVNLSPLGAGALAGTSFPIDRKHVARSLGFDGLVENSIDAVSDRDALLEFMSTSAITMMHLSRWAEELVLWSSQEWGFADIGEEFTTGSSIMPQKKNPDMAELIRGKTGRVYGDLVALLTVMKGLPLAYNRDMQEDKEPVFDAATTLADCLHIAALMMKSTQFTRNRFTREGGNDFLLATELADYLVRKGVPFRKAHAIAGGIVVECHKSNRRLKEIPLKELQRHSKFFGKDVSSILNLRTSLAAKKSSGSTSPKEVATQIRRWKKRLSQ
ncbi:MAG: argininosuccinate lyase [Bacteroidota bacterium]